MTAPDEPDEVMRTKARSYATSCNDTVRKPYGKKIYMALELARHAYEAHGLEYEAGLHAVDQFPPDRFTLFCDEAGDAKECVNVRDNRTGQVVVWSHWPR
jgi:hypothetical protein